MKTIRFFSTLHAIGLALGLASQSLQAGVATVPEISVKQLTDIPDTGSMDYGNVLTGTTSSLTYTIENTGDADLTDIAITTSGANEADFSVVTPPATTVVPGGSTTFVLEFTPGAVGSRSAAIEIANNDSDENPFHIAVTGTGIAPEIAVSGSGSYGGVLLGTSSSLTYTIENTGSADLTGIAITTSGANAEDFSVTTVPESTVAAGGSTTFVVKFTPGGAGDRSATIQIANDDSDENPFDIAVTGTGTTAPEIAVEQGTEIADAGSKSYGDVFVGTSSSLTYTIKNIGTANLTGIVITKDGTNSAEFLVSTVPATTVVPGGSTTFVVEFKPGATGSRSAAIHIANSDSNETPFDINLSGTGITPEISVEQLAINIPDAGSKSYGSVLIGNSKSLIYTIKNTGSGDLTGIAITKSGINAADFSVTTAPASTVVPDGSTTFVVEFKPGATGSRSAAIQIANNDINEKQFDINLSGTGVAPEIAVEQPLATNISDSGSKSYGSVLVGSSKSLTYTIKNTGTYNLTGISISKNGTHAADFEITSFPAATVAPGGSTTFELEFTPGATGSRSAAIHIANNDSNENPFDIVVTGTGTTPEISVEQPLATNIPDAGSKSYGSVLVGTSKSLTYTIKNTGTASLTGIAITKSGTNAADFTITTPPAVTVAPGGSTNFVVKFAPGDSGSRSAAIQIANNDRNESPFNIVVTGTGTEPEISVEQPLATNIPDAGSRSYGTVLVGTSKSLTYTIKNTGNGNLTGIVISKSGTNASDFSVATAPATAVVPGGSTTFVLKFSPTGVGSRSAAIHIANNDSNEKPFDIILSGSGLGPEISVQQPLATNIPDAGSKDYGNVLVGGQKSLTYTIKNTGDGKLIGIAITKSGTNAADFTVTAPPAVTVAPGGSTTFVVKFAPRGVGSRSAAIHIASNDINEKQFDINLSGTGTSAASMGSIASSVASGLFATTPDDTSKTVITVNSGDGLKYLTLEVMKAPGTAEQRRVVEVSSNLLDWYSGSNHTTVIRDDASVLKVRDNTPSTPETKRYIRLRQPK